MKAEITNRHSMWKADYDVSFQNILGIIWRDVNTGRNQCISLLGPFVGVLWSGFEKMLFGLFVSFDKGNRFIVKDEDLEVGTN